MTATVCLAVCLLVLCIFLSVIGFACLGHGSTPCTATLLPSGHFLVTQFSAAPPVTSQSASSVFCSPLRSVLCHTPVSCSGYACAAFSCSTNVRGIGTSYELHSNNRESTSFVVSYRL